MRCKTVAISPVRGRRPLKGLFTHLWTESKAIARKNVKKPTCCLLYVYGGWGYRIDTGNKKKNKTKIKKIKRILLEFICCFSWNCWTSGLDTYSLTRIIYMRLFCHLSFLNFAYNLHKTKNIYNLEEKKRKRKKSEKSKTTAQIKYTTLNKEKKFF